MEIKIGDANMYVKNRYDEIAMVISTRSIISSPLMSSFNNLLILQNHSIVKIFLFSSNYEKIHLTNGWKFGINHILYLVLFTSQNEKSKS